MRCFSSIVIALVLCAGQSAIAEPSRGAKADDPYQEGIRDYQSGLCFRARPHLDDPEKERVWERDYRYAEQHDRTKRDWSYYFPGRG
jgi:hypothetical protein